MRPSRALLALCPALLAASACTPTNPAPPPGPERVLVVDSDGRVVRQSTADEHSRAQFAAPVQRVWSALMVGYAELGIDPSVADQATWRYGNGGFVAPRRMADRPLGVYFHCGSGLTGPLVDTGRLTANVVTTLAPMPDGTTTASTYVSGRLRRNDGTSTDPIVCASTGAIEEYLRTSVEKRLATKP